MFFLILIMFSSRVFAYVENVTHGYVNCMACHVSVSGGGVLNQYGRSLSKELMSTWGWKDSEHPLFGAIKNTDSILVGGDYRVIQTRLENEKIKQGKQFTMESNIELAVQVSPEVVVVGTAGKQEGPKEVPTKGDFISDRHFVQISVDRSKIRAGKFRHHFGLNDPAHTRFTKSAFGFGSGSEHYIFEYSFFTDTHEIFVTSDFGRVDKRVEEVGEKSLSINYAKYLGETSKVGASYLTAEQVNERRSLYNLYGIVSLPLHSFIKFENVYQAKYQPLKEVSRTNSFASVLSVGNQTIKGFTPYLLTEFYQQDLKKSEGRITSLGGGLSFMPIPHVEFNFEYQRRKSRTPAVSYTDFAYLIFHFYI